MSAIVERYGNTYYFIWEDPPIGCAVDRIEEDSRNGLMGELTFRHTIPAQQQQLYGPVRLNLLSSQAQSWLARDLEALIKEVDWRRLVIEVCHEIAATWRGRPNLVFLSDVEPQGPLPDLLENFIPSQQTTILCGDGGTCKSFIALGIGVAVQEGIRLSPRVVPIEHQNVLYLDWEDCADEHAERLYQIAQGLMLDHMPHIAYVEMTRPLHESIEEVKEIVDRENIGFVIIDSLALACGAEPESSDSAVRTMGALRRLNNTTRLIVAHVSKAQIEKKATFSGPIGSIYFKNLSRSVWEVAKSPEEVADHTIVGLFHRKVNRGRMHSPFSLAIYFDSSERVIQFSEHDITDSVELTSKTTLATQIIALLKTIPERRLSAQAMAEYLETTDAKVRVALNRMKDRVVVRLGEATDKNAEWGLVSHYRNN